MIQKPEHELAALLREWCKAHGVYSITARLNLKERHAESWKVSMQGHKHSVKDRGGFAEAMMGIEEVLGAPPAHPAIRMLDTKHRYGSEFFGLDWTSPGYIQVARSGRAFAVEPSYDNVRLIMVISLQAKIHYRYIDTVTFQLQFREKLTDLWQTLTMAQCQRTDDPQEVLHMFLSSAARIYGAASTTGSFCERLLVAMAAAAEVEAAEAEEENDEA